MNVARNSQKIWRVIDLIKWGEQYFADNGFDSPKREIELLLQETLGCSRVDLYLRFEEPLDKKQLTKLRDWVQRRKNREPTQYITGKAGFYNLLLNVTPDVLIPRPESERLIDEILTIVDVKAEISILDVGTGSGCLALALGKELPKAKVTGIDSSDKAIELAKLNSDELNINNIFFLHADFFTFTTEYKYDILVSNPPYIPKKDINSLMPEVNEFEPISALTDSSDGLNFYRKISANSSEFIKKDGWLFLEVGLGEHPKMAMELFTNEKFSNVELIKDFNNDYRVLKAQIA